MTASLNVAISFRLINDSAFLPAYIYLFKVNKKTAVQWVKTVQSKQERQQDIINDVILLSLLLI